jgi:hypothetical protein
MPPPWPPAPPFDVAVAVEIRDPVEIEVVAVDAAAPPGPPVPRRTMQGPSGKQNLEDLPPAPPLPPVAVAVFDASLGNIVVVAVAVAAPPPAPAAPFAPVTVTLPACADIAPAASKPTGTAVASSSGRRKELRRLILIMASSD